MENTLTYNLDPPFMEILGWDLMRFIPSCHHVERSGGHIGFIIIYVPWRWRDYIIHKPIKLTQKRTAKGTAIKEHHYYNIRQRLIIYSPIHPLVFLNLASYVPLPSSIFKAFYSHAWQNIKALSIIYSNGETHEHKSLLCSVSENQLKRS